MVGWVCIFLGKVTGPKLLLPSFQMQKRVIEFVSVANRNFPPPTRVHPPPQISARNDLKHRLPSNAALAGQGWFLGRRFEKKAAFGTKRDLLGVERNVAQLPFSWGPDRTALYSM